MAATASAATGGGGGGATPSSVSGKSSGGEEFKEIRLAVTVAATQYPTDHAFELRIYLEKPYHTEANGGIGTVLAPLLNAKTARVTLRLPPSVPSDAAVLAHWYAYRCAHLGRAVEPEVASAVSGARLQRYCTFAGAARGMTLHSLQTGRHEQVPIVDADGEVVANLSLVPSEKVPYGAVVPYPSPRDSKTTTTMTELDDEDESKMRERLRADNLYTDGHAAELVHHPYGLPTNIKCIGVAMFDNVRTPFHEPMPMWVYPHMAWQGAHIFESAVYDDVEGLMQSHFLLACMIVNVCYDPEQSQEQQMKWWRTTLTASQRCRIICTMHGLVPGALLYVSDITRRPTHSGESKRSKGEDVSTDAWVHQAPCEVGGDDCESLAPLVLHHISLFRSTLFEHPILEHERTLMIDGYVTLFVVCVLQPERGSYGYHITVQQVDRAWLEHVCGRRKERPRVLLPSKLLEATSWIDHNRDCKPTNSSLTSDTNHPVPSRPRLGTDEVVPEVYQFMQIACPMEWNDVERIDFTFEGKTGVPMDRFVGYEHGIVGHVTALSAKKRASVFARYSRNWPNLQRLRRPDPESCPALQLVSFTGICPADERVRFESWYRYIDWDGEDMARDLMKNRKLRGLAVWLMHIAIGCRAYFVRGY